MSTKPGNVPADAQPEPPQPGFRSGTVARLANLPVSTLRIWEQRYRVVKPYTTPSGHRLYSKTDVERVTLMRLLSRHGHAIGSLAEWTMDQLRDEAQTLATTWANQPQGRPLQGDVLRLIVVGPAMGLRLEQLQQRKVPKRAFDLIGVYETLTAATQAGQDQSAAQSGAIDLMLVQLPHLPDLPDSTFSQLREAQLSWKARGVAVSYRFTHAKVRESLSSMGVELVREPPDDKALAHWLDGLSFPAREQADSPVRDGHGIDAPAWSSGVWKLLRSPALPAQLYDDIALTTFAGMSSRIACECPSHVAELLKQISSFERYSASCVHLRPGDAELHADLQKMAGVARVMFETALQRIAHAEGIG